MCCQCHRSWANRRVGSACDADSGFQDLWVLHFLGKAPVSDTGAGGVFTTLESDSRVVGHTLHK